MDKVKWILGRMVCRLLGGVLEPLPCSWYNAYCEEKEECVYKDEPVLIIFGNYCCREVKE